MWPFTKKPILIDTLADGIMLDEAVVLPLDCDEEQYQNSLTIIESIFRKWMQLEIDVAANTNTPLDHTLPYQLRNIDLKFLPYPVNREMLDMVLKDNEISRSGSRFFDIIVTIYSSVPSMVLETMRGRFMYGMLYGLPRIIDDKPLPSKEEWVSLLAEHPWVPLLHIQQQLFDSDLSIAVKANALEEKPQEH